MYKVTFYMKSGNVVEIECKDFILKQDQSGKCTGFEYVGAELALLSVELACIEAVKVVKL